MSGGKPGRGLRPGVWPRGGGSAALGRGMRLGAKGGLTAPLSGGSCRAVLICAWAEEGADALGPDGRLLHSDAFPPPRVVDTLGAGDTFNASVIFSLSQGECPGRRRRAEARPGPAPAQRTRLIPLSPSREGHAGGFAVWLPGGRQEVRLAGLRRHRVNALWLGALAHTNPPWRLAPSATGYRCLLPSIQPGIWAAPLPRQMQAGGRGGLRLGPAEPQSK